MASAAATRHKMTPAYAHKPATPNSSAIVLLFSISCLASSVASLTWRLTSKDAFEVSSLTRSALDIASGMEVSCTGSLLGDGKMQMSRHDSARVTEETRS